MYNAMQGSAGGAEVGRQPERTYCVVDRDRCQARRLFQNKNVGDCWRVPVLAGCVDRLEWTPLPVVSCVTGAEPGLSLVAIPEYGRTAARFRQYPLAMSLCNQHKIRLE
jgi:hypothetical protein